MAKRASLLSMVVRRSNNGSPFIIKRGEEQLGSLLLDIVYTTIGSTAKRDGPKFSVRSVFSVADVFVCTRARRERERERGQSPRFYSSRTHAAAAAAAQKFNRELRSGQKIPCSTSLVVAYTQRDPSFCAHLPLLAPCNSANSAIATLPLSLSLSLSLSFYEHFDPFVNACVRACICCFSKTLYVVVVVKRSLSAAVVTKDGF